MKVVADADQWNSLQAKAQEARVVSAFESFRAAGIEPILIKGWAAARNYSTDHRRRPGDIDLAVCPADFGAGLRLLEGRDIAALLIDLHDGMWQLDSLS